MSRITIRRAFTLIELLIVVAIIAILAAIAVPNFLEAQTRAKISRTKSDMRTASTALEAYYVDNNAYPNPHRFGTALNPEENFRTPERMILERLSTPVSYMANALITDPFKIQFRLAQGSAAQQIAASGDPQPVNENNDAAARFNSYIYQSFDSFNRYTIPPDGFSMNNSGPMTAWVLHSAGPDGVYSNLGGVLGNDRAAQLPSTINWIYDPTNGTVSFGSIWRTGGSASPTQNYAAGEGLLLAIRTQR